MADSHETHDPKLDRRILGWKIALNMYEAVIVTVILIILITEKT